MLLAKKGNFLGLSPAFQYIVFLILIIKLLIYMAQV